MGKMVTVSFELYLHWGDFKDKPRKSAFVFPAGNRIKEAINFSSGIGFFGR
jgi:hypothetical protein